MIYCKSNKGKRNARYIREGSCIKAAPLTKNLKAREGIDHIVSNFLGSDPRKLETIKMQRVVKESTRCC